MNNFNINDEELISPEDAKARALQIRANMDGPYWNPKATIDERNRAIFLVNKYDAYAASGRPGNISNEYLMKEYESEKSKRMNEQYGSSSLNGSGRSSAFGNRSSDNIANTYNNDINDGKSRKSGYGNKIEDID